MKRLFIKEWTENRLIPVWCALLLGLLMVASTVAHMVAPEDSPQLLFGSWIAAAVFTAAGLVSREVGSESLQFLMSLPVSRRSVWMIKCAAGLSILLTAIALTTMAWIGVQAAMSGRGFDRMFVTTINIAMPYASRTAWFIGGALACFSVSLALSSLLDRAISTAMLAVVICTALMIPIGMFTAAYHIRPLDDLRTIIVIAALCFPAFMTASYWSFTRGESLRTGRRFWYGAVGLALGLALVWTPATAGYEWWSGFHRYESCVDEAAKSDGGVTSLSPDGSMLLLQARHNWPFHQNAFYAGTGKLKQEEAHQVTQPDGSISYVYSEDLGGPDHFVIQPVAGPGPRRVLPAGKVNSWSPDGRFLLYRRELNNLGLYLNSNSDSTFLVDIRTGRERRLAWGKPLDSVWINSWSPDGRWLAVAGRAAEPRYANAIVFYDMALAEASPGNIQPASYLILDSNIRDISELSPGSQGWSADSRFYYTVVAGVFSTIELSKSPAGRSKVPLRNGAYEVQSRSLCKLVTDLNFQLTHNVHRSLFNFSAPGAKSTNHSLVDLAAATQAALQPRRGPVPPLTVWLARWMTVSLAATARETRSELTPDGRCLLVQDLSGKGRSTVTSIDLDAKEATQHTLALVNLNRQEWWLPDGHCFCAQVPQGQWAVIDPTTGFSTPVPEASSGHPLGVTKDGRLVVARWNITDVFNVVEKLILL